MSLDEMNDFFTEHSYDEFFTNDEIELVKNKNLVKSLGARYLIKKSIIEYFNLNNQYKNIEIKYNKNQKPEVELKPVLKSKLNASIKISLSHSRKFIATLVVIE